MFTGAKKQKIVDRETFEAAWRLCELALTEELGVAGDVTSMVTIPPNHRCRARFVAAQSGVVAGIPAVIGLYAQIDESIRYYRQLSDGETVKAGDVICEFAGKTRSLLAGERIALNFLQRLSGIATLTQKYVLAIGDTKAVVVSTPRMLPGWGALERYAIEMGGGQNQRPGLFDAIVIGKGHTVSGSIAHAVRSAMANPIAAGLPVVVQVHNLREFDEAIGLDVSRILLAGMTDRDITAAIKRNVSKIQLEFVGRISINRAKTIVELGVDFIGVVDATQYAPPLEVTVQMMPIENA